MSDHPNTPVLVSPSTAATVLTGGLTRRDFFADLLDEVRRSLPEDLAAFKHRQTMNLVKVFYGNERVHYEVWANAPRRMMEIGLHFEDGPVSTTAYLAHFDEHIVELKHALGPEIELERWTVSWGHLFEVRPLGRLDQTLAQHTARRLTTIIKTLQPLLELAEVPPERAAAGPRPPGPWRARRRR